MDLNTNDTFMAWTLLIRDKEHFIRKLAEKVEDHSLLNCTPSPRIISDHVGASRNGTETGKAAGICDIPAELLKSGGEPLEWGLLSLDCHLAQGFAHILLDWIHDYLLRHQRPEQSGLIPGKYTRDLIPALQVIVECHCEFGHWLLAAYINLKKALD
ncbi:uncharacterized protein LOC125047552 [Penaeus chinensis]|uniref:uncharacterized protein LOC125047552 n=1 Tax=Penaeus chinensis TaxID=139456 RepID=UPI001FB6E7C2|nr:uncharacterized protein LOC125047552 [Penaeus chinensis]